jgi:pimeloyl-ACP methyl ester carboxylesterase
MSRSIVTALVISAMLVVSGCDSDSKRPVPTATPTTEIEETPPIIATPTATPSAPPTEPPGPTESVTPTASASASATPTPTTPTSCSFSPTPGASATITGTATATYTPLICPVDTQTPTPAGACTVTTTPTSTGTRPQPPTPTPGPPILAALRLFDANPRYTSGVFLPLADYTAESVTVFTTEAWTDAARRPSGAAADGATLLLVSVQLFDPRDPAPVQLQIDAGDAPSGGLFAVDDQRLVDRSPDGGQIDDLSDGTTTLLVDTVLIGGERWAFALYRAPRDYGGADRSRTLRLSAFRNDAQFQNELFFDVVRPLVIFLHGTAGDTSNWDQFALWRDSANDLNDFAGGVLPFYADRISFQWISLASGHLTDNAATILPQIGRALESWKLRLNIAATQADVVTHSYGGPTARQVAQTQPDPDPLTTADQANFRAVTNWGHGSIRALVTLAATHRGSALANSVAYLNQLRDGALRTAVCIDGVDIAAGALGDQLVLSPALRGLQETRLPGHAVIGSGTVQFADMPLINQCDDGSCEVCYRASGYHGEYSLYQTQDVQNGPYQGAGNLGGSICGFNFFCEDFNYDDYNRLTNYAFNLAYAAPFPYPDCDLPPAFPNYDLTVSACSSRGQQPTSAYSTVEDFDPALQGHLSHMQLLNTPAVSERVQFVLEQPTTSDYFAHFAATGGPTCLEEQLMNVGSAAGLGTGSPCSSGPDDPLINSCYDACNSCEATADTPPCFVEYKVVPEPLVLRQLGQAAPVFVYGLVTRGPLDGQWTNVQSLANGIWCSVTMHSDAPSVASITTWSAISGVPDQSGINVIQAVGAGSADVSLTVQGNNGFGLDVGVLVDTTPPAQPE